MKLFNLNIKIFSTIILLICMQSVYAQRNKVPVNLQTKVIPKILSLNKNFSTQLEGQLNALIIYSNEQRNSKQIFDSFIKNVNEKKIKVNSKVTNFIPYDIKKISSLREFIITNKIGILYITPVRGVDISLITKICREEDVLSITGVEEYKENNVSVILSLEKSKLKIMINQDTAKGEGVNFSSRLLKIATLIN